MKKPSAKNKSSVFSFQSSARQSRKSDDRRLTTDSSFFKIGEAAKLLGVSIDTLRRWEKAGKITAERTPGGTRLYSLSALKKINPTAVEESQTVSLTTEELLKRTDETKSVAVFTAEDKTVWETSFESADDKPAPVRNSLKNSFLTKFLMGSALIMTITLILTSWITGSYLTNPKEAKQFFKNNIASGFFKPFHFLAEESIAVLDPKKARELGFFDPEPPPIGRRLSSSQSSRVLAVTASSQFLEINSDTQINGSLFVRDAVNGLTMEATSSAGTMTFTAGSTTLTVTKTAKLDQDVSTAAGPAFSTLNLSAKEKQLTFQSGGPAGIVTWTPTAERTITLPDATTTLVGINNTQTLTNKSMSGSSNTFTNIPNSALTNSKVTISAGTNLTGGGDVTLGSSVTIALKDSPTVTTLTTSGIVSLADGTAAAPALTFTSDLDTGLYRIGTNKIGLITAGSATSGITIDASGNVGIGTIAPLSTLAVSGNLGIGFTGTSPAAPNLGLAVQGNIGIGTTSPNNRLQVVGSAVFGTDYNQYSAPANGVLIQGNVGIGSTGGANYNLDIWGTSRITSALTVGGNIGVGASASVTGLTYSLGGLRVNGFSDLTGNLGVGGTANFASSIYSEGSFYGINGAATAPAYSFTASTNTGLWSPSANALSLTTSGSGTSGLTVTSAGLVGIGITSPSQIFQINSGSSSTVITSTGNVGIGTTSPVAPLHVWGNNTNSAFFLNGNVGIGTTTPVAQFNLIGTEGLQMKLEQYSTDTTPVWLAALKARGTQAAPSIVASGDDILRIAAYAYDSVGAGRASASIFFSVDQTPTGSKMPGRITFKTTDNNNNSNVERMRIDSAGNVGIGFTSPAATLDVVGTSMLRGAAGTLGLTVTGAGNIGIGTTSPKYRLQINTTSTTENDGLMLSNDANAISLGYIARTNNSSVLEDNIIQHVSAADGGTIWIRAANIDHTNSRADLRFMIRGADGIKNRMVITSLGNVGIGATLPQAKLVIQGNVGIGYTGINQSIPVNGLAVFGNVGVGTTTANSTLSVAGGAVFGSGYAGMSGPANGLLIENRIGIGTTAPGAALAVTGAGLFGTYASSAAPSNGIAVSGNVGIGTTSPASVLHIVGQTTVTDKILANHGGIDIGTTGVRFGTIYADTFNATTLIGTVEGGQTNSADWTINADNATDDGQEMSVTFKRGTASPNAIIGWDIVDKEFDFNSGLNVTGTIASTYGIRLTDTTYDIATGTNQHLVLWPNGTGNVGIGTTSPGSYLSVAGNSTIGFGGTTAINGPASGLAVSGNVGIGTTSPLAPLHVWGNNTNSAFFLNGNVGIGTTAPLFALSVVSPSLNTTISLANDSAANVANSAGIGFYTNRTTGGQTQAAFIEGQLTNIGNTTYTGVLKFHTANTGGSVSEKMRITSGGNVGIGFTSPAATLDVVGTSMLRGTAGTLGLTVTGAGNVGIGITAPDSMLKLYNTVNQPMIEIAGQTGGVNARFGDLIFQDTASSPNIQRGFLSSAMDTASNTYLSIGADGRSSGGNAYIAFATFTTGSVTEKMRLDSSGNLGIGATLPYAKLSIQGNVGIGYTGINQSIPVNGLAVSGNVGIGTTTANSLLSVAGGAHIGSALQGFSAPTDGLFVDGNVGIGTTTSDNKLNVWGNARITGTLALDSTLTSLNGLIGYSGVTAPTSGLAISGNVGVGTTSPGAALDVVGNQKLSGNLALGGSALDSNRYQNLDITIAPSATTYGIYNKIVSSTAQTLYGSYNIATSTTNSDFNGLAGNWNESTYSGSGTINVNYGGYFQAVNTSGGTISGGAYGIEGDVENSGSGTIAVALGTFGLITNSSNGTITDARSVRARLNNTSTGTVTTSSLLWGEADNTNAGGTIGTLYGLRLDGWSNSGTVNNSYGIYMDNSIDLGTTRYALYSSSASNSYFAGNVGIGASLPYAKLSIQGNVGIGYTGINQSIPVNGLAVFGNVGIGTTTANSLLSVAGGAHIGSALQGFSAPTDGLFVDGNVGIGATTSDNKLDVWGNARIAGTLTVDSTITPTGQFLAIDGSKTAPSYSFASSGNSDNGMYLPSANALSFSTAGSDRLTVTAEGYVGIGTTAPKSKLHIDGGVGTIATGLTFGDGDTGFFELSDDRLGLRIAAANTLIVTGNVFASGAASYGFEFDAGTGSATIPTYRFESDADTGVGRAAADVLSLIAGGVNVLNVTAGNVGIGTSGPQAKLSIQGNVGIGYTGVNQAIPVNGLAVFGNVGIGTTTANSLLSVAGGAHIGSARQGTSAPTDGLFVDGNVGIGTTTSDNKLDVWGNARIAGTGTFDSTLTALNGLIGYSGVTAPTSGLAVAGNIGIGTTSPLGQLHVVGQCVAEGTRIRRRRRGKNGEWIEEDIPVEDIKPDDEVLSLNDRTGRWEWHKVEKTMDMGIQEVFGIKTSGGKYIKTTSNHPYLVQVKPPKIISGVFEVDLSNRIEDINKSTFIALANQEAAYIIKLPAKTKQILKPEHQKKHISKFGFQIYAHLIKQMIQLSCFRINKLIIDHDYAGNEEEINAIIKQSFPGLPVEFKSIGHGSPADRAAHAAGTKGVGISKTITAEEFLAWKTTKKETQFALKGATEATDHQGCLPRFPLHRVSKEDYHNPYKLSTGETRWVKVGQLNHGDKIATVDGWEYVIEIEELDRVRTYDLQIEGTHNFVGNDIIAHNTYINGNLGIGSYSGLTLPSNGLAVSGNVGIGTTSPVAPLHVWGNNTNSAFFLNGNVGIGTTIPGDPLYIYKSQNTGTRMTIENPNTGISASSQIQLKTADGSGWMYRTGANYYLPQSADSLIIGDWGGGHVIFTAGAGTEYMRLTSTGNVGIGATLPYAKLSIQGNVGIGYTGVNQAIPANGLAVFGNVGIGTTTANSLLSVAGGAHIGSALQGFSAPTDGLFVDGNVGIGATTSDNKLDVWGNARIAGTGIFDSTLTALNGLIGYSGVTAPTSGLAISGNLGVGTTSPAGALHVVGQCVIGETKLKRRRRRKGKNGEWIEEWEDVAIKDIKEGDEILSLNEETGEFIASRVRALKGMGVRQVFELTTESGKSIQTTANHPYLVNTAKEACQQTNIFYHQTFESILNTARAFYQEVLEGQYIRVKALRERIYFSREGWDHIYTGHVSKLEIMSRFFALLKIVPLLKLAKTAAEEKSRTEKGTTFWALQGIIEGTWVKVVIRETKDKPKHFYSVVWKGEDHSKEVKNAIKKGAVSRLYPRFQAWDKSLTFSTFNWKKYNTFVSKLQGEKNVLHLKGEEKWIGVKNLHTGQKIATVNGWEKIVSIKSKGRKATYDIEVSGTHNFVGNDIIAHNTYINGNLGIGSYSGLTLPSNGLAVSGNVGIGTTSPVAPLHVWGNNTNSAFFLNGNVGIGTTSPTVQLNIVQTIDPSAVTGSTTQYTEAPLNQSTALTLAGSTAINSTTTYWTGTNYETTIDPNNSADWSKADLTGLTSHVTDNSSSAIGNLQATYGVVDINSSAAITTARTTRSHLNIRGAGTVSAGVAVSAGLNILPAPDTTTDVTYGYAGLFTASVNGTGGSHTSTSLYGVAASSSMYGTVGGTYTATSQLGGTFTAQAGSTTAGNIATVNVTTQYGVYAGAVANSAATATTTIGTQYGVYVTAGATASGTTTVTDSYGVYIVNGLSTNTGNVTNAYGLYLENITHGDSINYAIYSAGGTNYFGGNVGIGASLPYAKLSIQGNVGIGYTGINQSIPVNGLAVFGNVGIGTTTANSLLSVAGGAHIGSALQGFSAPTDGLFVDGNVGIGATTSDNKLDVWGNARVTGTGTFDSTLTALNSLIGYSGVTAPTSGLAISGNLGVGTTSPAGALHVVGQCVAQGTRIRRRRRGKNGEWIEEDIPVEDINPDDEVLSLNDRTGKWEWHKVEKTMDMGIQEVFELLTKTGKSIQTTSNHPYLIKQQKTRLLSEFFDGLHSNELAPDLRSLTIPENKDSVNNSVEVRGIEPPLPDFVDQEPHQSTPTLMPLSQIITKWVKVSQLKKGMEIATADGFEEIVSIKKTGRKQTYDLQIANTHNFLANDIVAHNTYINGNLGIGSYSGLTLPSNGLAVSGNVGIGTTSPLAPLHVWGNNTNSAFFLNGNVGIGTTNPALALHVSTNADGFRGAEIENTNAGSSAAAYLLFKNNNNNNGQIFLNSSNYSGYGGTKSLNFYASAGPLAFMSNGASSPEMVIKSGNVGIGATLPQAKLSIQGNVGIGYTGVNQSIPVNGLAVFGNVGIGTTTANSTLSISGSAHIGSALQGFSAPTDGLFVDGNVGIGATTSDNKLDVWGNARISGTLTADQTTSLANTLTALSSSGRVGIGTTAPISALQVNGNIAMGDAVNPPSYAQLQYYGTNSNYHFAFRDLSNSNAWLGLNLDSNGATWNTEGNKKFMIYDNSNSTYATFSWQSGLALGPGASYPRTSGSPTLLTVTSVADTGITKTEFNDIKFDLSATRTFTTGGGTITNQRAFYIKAPTYAASTNAVTLTNASTLFIDSAPNAGSNVTITNPAALVIASGNVGIGTSVPGAMLSVSGDGTIGFGNTTSIAGPSNGLAVSGNVGIGTTSPNNKLQVVGAGVFGSDWGQYSAPANGLLVQGNVGIGATSTAYNLDLWGTGRITSALTVGGNIGVGGSASVTGLTYGLGGLRINGFSDLTGNVGIGGTAVFNSLIVSSGHFLPSANDTYDLGSNAYRFRDLYLGPDTLHLGTSVSDEYTLSYDTSANSLGFNINGSGPSEITFDSNGNIGIGTSQPQAKLSIQGNVGIGYTGVNQSIPVNGLAVFGNVGIGTTTANSTLSISGSAHIGSALQGFSAPADGLFVDGNVGIGATTSDNKLDVWGNARIAGTLTVDSTLTNSSVFRAANGSATTPAYSFTNLTDAGLWSAGSGLLLTTGGSNTSGITVTGAGNVGIGTTSPARQAEIVDTNPRILRLTRSTANGGGSGIEFKDGNGVLYAVSTWSEGDSAIPTMVFDVNGNVKMTIKDSGNIGIGTTSPNSLLSVAGSAHIGSALQGFSAPTDGLFVDGNVGIGATTSDNKLDVWGNARISGTLTVDSTLTNSSVFRTANGSAATPAYSFTNLTNAGLWTNGDGLLLTTGGSNTSGITVTGAGLVGIGTTAPGDKLEITGGGLKISELSILPKQNAWVTNTDSRIYTSQEVGGGGGIYPFDDTGKLILQSRSDSARDIVFATGATTPTVRMVIGSTGNIGIGTTTANSLLSVAGGAHIGSALQGFSAPTDGLFVDGNVGIGATTSDNKLDVWGNARITGTLSLDGNFTTNGTITPSGQFLAINGSKSAPSYSFASSGNGDNGMYLPSSNALSFSTAGNDVLTLTAAGNVGIGTTEPLNKLHVVGAVTGSGLKDAARFSGGGSTDVGNGVAIVFNQAWGDVGTYGNWDGGRIGTMYRTGNYGSDMVFQTNNGTSITDTSEKMRIQYNGNVGIGTTSPIQKLHVEGSTDTKLLIKTTGGSSNTATLILQGNDYTGTTILNGAGTEKWFIGLDGTTPSDNLIFRRAASANDMVINTSGNVGIGTSQPQAKLSIQGNVGIGYTGVNQSIPVNGLAVFGNVGIGTTTANSTLSISGSAHIGSALQGFSAPADGLFVDGNVGIGATTSDNKLDVWGNIFTTGTITTSSSNAALSLAGTNPSITSGGNLLGLFAGGNVGIGTTGNLYGGLTVRGAGTTTGITLQTYGSGLGQGLTVLDNGNVGIGTTSPAYALDIQTNANNYLGMALRNSNSGSSAATDLYMFNDDGNAQIFLNSSTNTAYGGAGSLNLFTKAGAIAFSTNNGNNTPVVSMVVSNGGNIGIGTTTANSLLSVAGSAHIGSALQGFAAPTDGLFVDGNIGIGATTSNNKLDVWGNIFTTGTITTSSSNAALSLAGTNPSITSGGNLLGLFAGGNVGIGTTGNLYGGLTVRGAGTGTNITLQTYGSGLGQGLSVLDNGNVGIGTTGPADKLQVEINSATAYDATNEGQGNGILVWNKNDTNNSFAQLSLATRGTAGTAAASRIVSILQGDGTADLAFITENSNAGTEKVRITSAGNVGIGFTSPDRLLQLGSDINIVGTAASILGANGAQFSITGSTANTINKKLTLGMDTTDNYGVIQAGNTDGTTYNLALQPGGGNVGIGTSTPAQKFDVRDGNAVLTDADVAHGMTGMISSGFPSTNTFGLFHALNDTAGGLQIMGITDADQDGALYLDGVIGSEDPTDANPAVVIRGGKKDGTTWQALGNSETVFQLRNRTNNLVTVLGIGNVGIGTSSPLSLLSVAGSAHIGSIRQGISAPTDGLFVDGNVGIGATSTAYNLDVWGTGRFSSALTVGGNLGIGTSASVSSLTFAQGGLRVNGYSDLTGNVGVGGTAVFNSLVYGTGSFLSGNGSATTPAYSFTNLTNAGLWTNGDGLLLTTGGSNTSGITVTGAGLVGIGTTGPSAQLHISGSDTTDQVIIENTSNASSSAPDLVLYRNASLASSVNIGLIQFRGKNNNASPEDINYTSILANMVDVTDGSEDSKLSFYTYRAGVETESLTINSGNVGIGATTSDNKLDVWGNARIAGTLTVDSTISPSGQFLAIDGSKTTPSYSFASSGNLDNGMYLPSANALSFSTADSDRLTITAGGNVGIGLTNPTGVFQVGSSATRPVLFASSLTGNVGIGTSTPNTVFEVNAGSIPNAATEAFRLATQGRGVWSFGFNANQGLYLYPNIMDGSSTFFSISTSNQTTGRFMVNTDTGDTRLAPNGGNVGIGMVSATATSIFQVNPTGTGSFVVKSDGNVGIGRTNPTQRLQVIGGTGTDRGINISDTLAANTNKNAVFTGLSYTTSTVPVALLNMFSTSTNNQIYLGGGYGTLQPATILSFWTASGVDTATAGTERLRITSGGNVGIGATIPDTLLQVGRTGNTGDLTVYGTGTTCTIGNGTGATNCTSDARLKTDVSTLDASTLDDVMQLNPVTFRWSDPNKPQNTNLGFIAQEVQQIFPEVVHMNSDGYWGLDYAALVVPAVKAIQEQQTLINSLQTNDATSSAAITALQSSTMNHELITVNSSGNVGIGTTDPGSYALYVNGSGFLNDTGWTYASDSRLKENVSSISTGLDVITALNPVTFDYINGGQGRSGFIAQEVAEVLPDLVSQRPDGMLTLRTDEILPFAVKAIQEQQNQLSVISLQLSAMQEKLQISSDGTLNVAKLKTGSITLDPALANTSVQLTSEESKPTSEVLAGPTFEVSKKLADLEKRLAALEIKSGKEATASAVLSTSKESEPTFEEATASAEQNTGRDDIAWKLTAPDILFATSSAQLANLQVHSEATVSGQLTAYNLNVSEGFKSFGKTTLSDTVVAGTLTVDGTLSIENGSEINVIGFASTPEESKPTSGVLYLQKSSLARGLDILNGAFTFDKDGTLEAKGTVLAIQFAVKKGSSTGKGIIPAGGLDAIIENTYVDEDSVILITPNRALNQTLAVSDKIKGGFLVELAKAEETDITFDYLIVGVK